jgi:WD40 repeat protein
MLRRWDRRQLNRAEQSIPTRLGDLFIDLDYSPDGRLLFVLHETSGIIVHDTATLKPMFALDCHHSDWRTVKVLAGREEVAAANAHGIVAIWNYKTGALQRIISANEDVSIVELAYSPDRQLLVVSPYELDEVLVYQADSGELVAQLPTTNHTAVAISRDGTRIAVDWLDDIMIFDVDSQKQILKFGGHLGTINSLAFSPNGKLIASGSVDREVGLWTVEGDRLEMLTGHLAEVTEVAFTPDGRTLLSADERGALMVSHIATKQSLFELPAPAERMRGIAISPDSRNVAAIRTRKGQHDVVVLGPQQGP